MYYLEFRTKICTDNMLDINYFTTTIANVPYTKFLGLVIGDTLTWLATLNNQFPDWTLHVMQ